MTLAGNLFTFSFVASDEIQFFQRLFFSPSQAEFTIAKEFPSGDTIWKALQSFDQMHLYGSSRKCIAVITESPEIQVKITETISELGNVKTKGFDDGTAGALLGAIPKGSKRTQQEIHEDKPVLWIQLSDFSGNFSENLSHAVDTLIHKVSKLCPFLVQKKNTALTIQTGGPLLYGYPDPLYLNHVFAQLLEIGITPESVQFETIQTQIKMTAFS
ncbi:DTX [Acanthosepion pharaonis]|uniref:DTX n=1 Tax=Acanthosepion pharaonis TaxID=158019 RepID=A0A812BRJ7_ACAPH|nr:DTX [Sepia pharaonis]